MIYSLYKTTSGLNAAMTVDYQPEKSFLFDPANTDYAQFKKDILDGAELLDADGQVMDAIQFVNTLP
jgi:hypothetical protein